MKNQFLKSLFFILIYLYSFSTIKAQDNSSEIRIEEKVKQSRVEELSKELDYSKTKKVIKPRTSKPKEVQEPRQKSGGIAGGLMNILFYLIILGIIIGVIILLIHLFSNIEETREVHYDDDAVEVDNNEDIHDLDLDTLLNQAILAKNYRVAIRTQFLMLLKMLSEENKISWSQEKTNRDYIREVRSQPYSPLFNQLVILFERIWYGNNLINEKEYNRTAGSFEEIKRFISQVNRTNE